MREMRNKNGVHYFTPDFSGLQTRERMRSGKKAHTAKEKAQVLKQVTEMRQAASLGNAIAATYTPANGLAREQMEDIKRRYKIGQE